MSSIVMDYLVAGGYTEAATAYANEVGLKAPDPSLVAAMDGRRRIIAAVAQGDIPDAIAQVVENCPEVRDTRGADDLFFMHHAEFLWIHTTFSEPRTNQILDTCPTLSFRLRQQLVIELLRSKRIDDALAIATAELGPLVEEYPHLREQLENVMALFVLDAAFDESSDAPAALVALASNGHREQTASELNAAMLEAQGRNPRAKLSQVLCDFALGQDLATQHTDTPVLDTSATLFYEPCK